MIVAFFTAILSGMGVGSAGLFVTWLSLVEQAPQLTAQGLNLIFFLFSSGAALLVHLFFIKLPLGIILLLILSGCGGSLLGTLLAGALPERALRVLFGVFLIVSGAVGLFSRSKSKKK